MIDASRRLVRRVLVTVLAIGLSTALAAPVTAGAPTDQLKAHVDQVIKVLVDPELRKDTRVAQRRAAIRKVATEIFDFEEITRRALGRHWQPRTADERREFVLLMADVLEQAYVGKLETYSGESVQFLGDTIDGDVATVRTKIVTKGGTQIPVDYRMINRGGRWIAYDVLVESVSLVANYRGQFDRIIQKQSYAELVRALRAKRGEEKDPDLEARRKERLVESTTPRPPPSAVSEPPAPRPMRQSP
jgi:phospholipid transport system substrate-binding protein